MLIIDVVEYPIFSSLLLIIMTMLIYWLNKKLLLKFKHWWLMPMLVTPLTVFLILALFSIPITDYEHALYPLIWLLGPAVTAFAIPIYEQRKVIFDNMTVLLIGILFGIGLNFVLTLLLSRVFYLSPIIEGSMLTHSVSSPFAIIISPYLGGDGNLAAVFAILTGIFGILIGELVLLGLGIKNKIATGMMYGSVFSVVGTAKAMEIGNQEGVIASLSMVLSGVFMVLMAPFLGWILRFI